MQGKIEEKSMSSPKKTKEQKLRVETNGIYAPGINTFFDEKREKLVRKFINKRLNQINDEEKENQPIMSNLNHGIKGM